MRVSEARKIAEFNKMKALGDLAKTEEFKTNITSIDSKILVFCEFGDLNCFFNVTEESQIMIDALTYYYRCRGYKVNHIDEGRKHLCIEW